MSNVKLFQSRVLCRSNAPDYAGLESDAPFSIRDFRRDFEIVILKHTAEEIVFEMIGINVAIANALRRIMIAEVPTMAIEKVIIRNNTTVMHDEMLAHRLGLVPLRINPNLFEMPTSYEKIEKKEDTVLVFNLKVDCKHKPKEQVGAATAPTDRYINAEVCSDQLKWAPFGEQASRFESDPPRCVDNDILLAKMRPGQKIDLEAHVVKGIGREHAKWSPVATAAYQMLPEVRIVEPIVDEDAHRLVQTCPMRVFDIEDCVDGEGKVKAVSRNPRRCTLCRECLRDPSLEKRLSLERVKNHFIFSVESTGCIPPADIVKSAISILREKALYLTADVEALTRAPQ